MSKTGLIHSGPVITIDHSLTLTQRIEIIQNCAADIERKFYVMGQQLCAINDGRLYQELGYFSFKEFCEKELGRTYERARQLIQAYKAVENDPNAFGSFSTDRQVRAELHPPRQEPREFLSNEATWAYSYRYTPESELTPEMREIRDKAEDRYFLQRAKEIKAEQAEERRTERIAKVVELAQVPAAPLNTVGRFPLIYADPPWQYDFISVDAWKVENHYPTMPIEEICALPVSDITTKDAILFLWATAPKLADAMRVVAAWGFTYKTCAIWDKEWTGMGNYFRVQHELLLIATQGSIPPPTTDNRPASIVRHKRSTTHSEKPEVFYEIIESMYPELPKVELFARSTREGWKAWGNQVEGAK